MNRSDVMGRYIHVGGQKLDNHIEFEIESLNLKDFVHP